MGVFGTRLFGQTDRVPGLFCVRTKFFHLNFVPLIPLTSYLVFEEKGSEGRGIELKKLRWNSVLLAWVRTPLWIAAAVGAVVGSVQGIGVQHDWQGAAAAPAIALVASAAWYVSYRLCAGPFASGRELPRTGGR